MEAKIVLVGNSGVGKTCIASRYTEGKFNSNHEATVGASFFVKNYTFPDGSVLKLNMWDTAGQDKFKSIGPLYYKDAQAAVLVYAIDDESSFVAVDSWIEQLENNANVPNLVKIVVGNKSDVPKERRKVTMMDGKRYAEERQMEFIETSAMVNDGTINDLFATLATQIRKTFKDEELGAHA